MEGGKKAGPTRQTNSDDRNERYIKRNVTGKPAA